MRRGWIVLAFALGGLGSVTVSCGAATFACASDDECQSGATNGVCQVNTEQSVNAQVLDLASQTAMSVTSEDLPGLPVSLQLLVYDDGSVRFEHSQDEVTWTSIADGSYDGCGSFTGPLTSSIFSTGDLPQGALQGYQRFEACVP